jgi:hypothetical protein
MEISVISRLNAEIRIYYFMKLDLTRHHSPGALSEYIENNM